MGFRSEKELAILLVFMVCFMAVQTLFILHVDSRVDRILNDQNEIRQNADDEAKDSIRVKHIGKRFSLSAIADKVGAIYIDDFCREVSNKQDIGGGPSAEEVDYVLRVLTAEAGNDEVLCGCIAQCLFNACEKHEWEYAPDEIMVMYQYTSPSDWISEAATTAYDDVFCSGVTYESVGNAVYFYAPRYCDSEWHEQQDFVCEINGVRFFEENG